MTREQAQFIAARVPGAKAVGPSPNSWVRFDAGQWGVSCDSGGTTRLHTSGEGTPVDAKVIAEITFRVALFSSALADARAAGILPQEGEVVDHE